ncbi:MAG: nuclear transport factor 2 family protein [Mangrovibacterium sp.]|jgi:hypothetical protein
MKTLIILIGMILNSLFVYAMHDEIQEIKNVIVQSYIEGIFLKGDAALVSAGWHPECDIVILKDGVLTKLPARYWVERFDKNPGPLDPTVTFKFTDVKVTRYAAVAIVEIYTSERHLYTDYMCLYKFGEGWRIVTKIFCKY